MRVIVIVDRVVVVVGGGLTGVNGGILLASAGLPPEKVGDYHSSSSIVSSAVFLRISTIFTRLSSAMPSGNWISNFT